MVHMKGIYILTSFPEPITSFAVQVIRKKEQRKCHIGMTFTWSVWVAVLDLPLIYFMKSELLCGRFAKFYFIESQFNLILNSRYPVLQLGGVKVCFFCPKHYQLVLKILVWTISFLHKFCQVDLFDQNPV